MTCSRSRTERVPPLLSLHIPMHRWRVRFSHHSLTSWTRRKQLEELPSQCVRLEEDGGERVVPQHSARLRHLHGRPLLRLAGTSSSMSQPPRPLRTSFRGLIPPPSPRAAEDRRFGRDRKKERTEEREALRVPRPKQALPRARDERVPFAHERGLPGASRRLCRYAYLCP